MDSSRIRCHLWLKATSQGGAYGNFRVPRKPPALARAARWPPSPKAAARALDQLPRTPAASRLGAGGAGRRPGSAHTNITFAKPKQPSRLAGLEHQVCGRRLRAFSPTAGWRAAFSALFSPLRERLDRSTALLCVAQERVSCASHAHRRDGRHATSRRDIRCSEAEQYDDSQSTAGSNKIHGLHRQAAER